MIDTVRMEALLRIARNLGVARTALVGRHGAAQGRGCGPALPGAAEGRHGHGAHGRGPAPGGPGAEGGVGQGAGGRAGRGRPPARPAGAGTSPRGTRSRGGPALAGIACRKARAGTLILAPTHAIRRQASDAVRAGLAAEGRLHGRTLVIDRLVDRRLTRAPGLGHTAATSRATPIVFHRGVFGCRAGDICMVTGKEDGHVMLAGPDNSERRFRPSGNAATYFGLYDTERIELRAGERIRWTRNRKARPARFGHPRQPGPRKRRRGGDPGDRPQAGAVPATTGAGRSRSFTADPQLRHLDHAYCSTVHGAQGRTARGVIAVLDAHGAADQALFHVEVSRAAESFLLLTDDREALVEMLEARPGREEGALEALGLDPGGAARRRAGAVRGAGCRLARAGTTGRGHGRGAGCASRLRSGHGAGGGALARRGPAGGHAGIPGRRAGRA